MFRAGRKRAKEVPSYLFGIAAEVKPVLVPLTLEPNVQGWGSETVIVAPTSHFEASTIALLVLEVLEFGSDPQKVRRYSRDLG